MTKPDAGLRSLFRARIVGWQWSSVESGGTAAGIPDSEYCDPNGVQGWIEYKRTAAWAVTFRPLQVAWISRRARLGGRVSIAVRRLNLKAHVDELWLTDGQWVQELSDNGLRVVSSVSHIHQGGPSEWNWAHITDWLLR